MNGLQQADKPLSLDEFSELDRIRERYAQAIRNIQKIAIPQTHPSIFFAHLYVKANDALVDQFIYNIIDLNSRCGVPVQKIDPHMMLMNLQHHFHERVHEVLSNMQTPKEEYDS